LRIAQRLEHARGHQHRYIMRLAVQAPRRPVPLSAGPVTRRPNSATPLTVFTFLCTVFSN
jgi:hypothetical protein